jgi:rhamnosyltransferase
MTVEQDPRVLAVVVTYYPDAELLIALVRSLLSQVTVVLIVDNTPEMDCRVNSLLAEFADVGSSLEIIRLGTNCGIAAALNVGISVAIHEKFGHVLLCDQDSFPAADMVKQLLALARRIEEQGGRVGCIGPNYLDRVTGHMHRFQVQEPARFFYSTCAGDRAVPWVEVVTLITSGSLVPTNAFADVGLMQEEYFLDFVDTEWCHRARQCGYKLYGTALATMEHHVGDTTFPVWYGRWKAFSGYAPSRLYYRYRNGIFLLQSGNVPWRWKLRSGWTWMGNIYAYTLFGPHRYQNLKAILLGLWDGVCGRTGPLK